jgi:translation initiation factor IF-1
LKSFDGCGLDDAIARAIAEEKYATPTPILVQTVPTVMSRRDVIGLAFAPPNRHRSEGRRAHCGRARSQKDHDRAKEKFLQFDCIQLGHELVADTAGRTRKNKIKTLAGDRVTVEISPCDLEKGRLIFRQKDEPPGSSARPVERNHFRRR